MIKNGFYLNHSIIIYKSPSFRNNFTGNIFLKSIPSQNFRSSETTILIGVVDLKV